MSIILYFFELLFTYFQVPLLVTLMLIFITIQFTKSKIFGEAYKNILIIFCTNASVTLLVLILNSFRGLPTNHFISFQSLNIPAWHYWFAVPQLIGIILLPFLGFLPFLKGKYAYLLVLSILQNYPWIIETFLLKSINFPKELWHILPNQSNLYVFGLGIGYYLIFIFFKKQRKTVTLDNDDILDA